MKKIFSVFLVIILVLASILSTYSVEITDINNIVETHTNEQYGFKYSKFEDSSGRIIRTYKNENQESISNKSTLFSLNTDSNSKNYEYTKAVLLELGVKDSTIETFSDESLDKYATAKSIQSMVTYTKTDMEGSSQIISEDTALEEIALASASDPNLPIDFGNGEGEYDSYYNDFHDEYMVITFLICEMGNGRFYYSTDAEWLTPPIFRGTDSLGICVMTSSIINNTRYGWYSYKHTHVATSGVTQENVTEYFSETNFQNCISGNWRGSGALFNLKNDDSTVMDVRDNHYYQNHKVHYEFEAYVNTPKLEMYFEATATYEHATLTVNISPSLEISTDGSSASIGLNVEAGVDTRIVELPTPIHYVP